MLFSLRRVKAKSALQGVDRVEFRTVALLSPQANNSLKGELLCSRSPVFANSALVRYCSSDCVFAPAERGGAWSPVCPFGIASSEAAAGLSGKTEPRSFSACDPGSAAAAPDTREMQSKKSIALIFARIQPLH